MYLGVAYVRIPFSDPFPLSVPTISRSPVMAPFGIEAVSKDDPVPIISSGVFDTWSIEGSPAASSLPAGQGSGACFMRSLSLFTLALFCFGAGLAVRSFLGLRVDLETRIRLRTALRFGRRSGFNPVSEGDFRGDGAGTTFLERMIESDTGACASHPVLLLFGRCALNTDT